jgi:hypothetical protein
MDIIHRFLTSVQNEGNVLVFNIWQQFSQGSESVDRDVVLVLVWECQDVGEEALACEFLSEEICKYVNVLNEW